MSQGCEISSSDTVRGSGHGCLSCGYSNSQEVMSLGSMPLANSLLTHDQLAEEEPTYPILLVFCPECKLVQINDPVPPTEIFRDYLYLSSVSHGMVEQAKSIVHRAIERFNLNGKSLAVEVGSNDGYLLQFYQQLGIRALGVDPAEKAAEIAHARGVETMVQYFNLVVAKEIRAARGPADVIHANNVMAHVPDLNGFAEGIRTLLDEKGVAIVEVSYIRPLVETGAFDQVYSEHVCYYSLTSFENLIKPHNLEVFDVERLPIHGGSIRFYVAGMGLHDVSDSVHSIRYEEASLGMGHVRYYRPLTEKANVVRKALPSRLDYIKKQGHQVAGFGAAAKGTVMLNWCGLDSDDIDFVADDTPTKQGLYIPGVRIPISPTERLLLEMPEFTLLLAWNFADEILNREREYRERGGKFIIPLPEMKIV